MRLRRKVCLLGAPGVGKTSLVRRFVAHRFDDDFKSSISIAISKGTLELDDISLDMMLWDPGGSESWGQYNRSFISGASGLMFVVDATKPHTLDHLLQAQAKERVSSAPARRSSSSTNSTGPATSLSASNSSMRPASSTGT